MSMFRLPPGHWERGKSGQEWVCDWCPQCFTKANFYWNPSKSKGHCFRCGLNVQSAKTFEDLFGGKLVDASPALKLDWTVLRRWKLASTDRMAKAYLLRRLVSPDDVDAFEVSKDGWIRAPLDPLSKDLPPGGQVRQYSRSKSHWMSEPGLRSSGYLFGWRWLPTTAKAVGIVEGVFDVMAGGRGRAVATLGTRVSDVHWAALEARGIRDVFLWYDPDAAGREGARKAQARARDWGLRVAVVPQWHPRAAQTEPGDLGAAMAGEVWDAVGLRKTEKEFV